MQIARRLYFPTASSVNSFARSKRVFTNISSFVRGSNVYWRGQSSAASVATDVSKVRKGRRRVSKDERQTMVESFVNKYRAMNAGKFPTASDARKHVGGSYYVIRNMLQELVYKYKTSSMNKRKENVLEKEVARVSEASTDVEKVSSCQLRLDTDIHDDAQTIRGNDVKMHKTSSMIRSNENVLEMEVARVSEESTSVEKVSSSQLRLDTRIYEDAQTVVGNDVKISYEGSETSDLSETTLSEDAVRKPTVKYSNDVANQRHISKGEAEVAFDQIPEKPKHDVEERSPSEGGLDGKGSKPKHEHRQQTIELDEPVMDSSENEADKQEHSKISSMWGNLKSLADGIVNMWRKL